jgi:hypothetical protein
VLCFQRKLGGKPGAVDMLGSRVVSVEELNHVEAGEHHEGHKKRISNYNDTCQCY